MLKRTWCVGWLAALLTLQPTLTEAGGPGSPGGEAVWSELRVPGGVAALSRALDLSPAPEPERFLSELARRLYAFPDGDSLENAPRLVRLTQILAALARLEEAQAKFPVASGRVSLALAASRQDRSRLEDLLDVVGFRLIRRADRYQVERSDDREAAARARLLSDLGLDLDDFASRLNAGEAIAPEIPGEMVPVPLPLRVWTDTIFAGTVPPGRLFAAIASDRRTALAAHGFAALDDPTLLYLAASPAIVRSLVDRHAGGLAAFGRSLRLREGHLVLPGGVEALALWEELVGQRSSDPARFIDALFGRDDCRLAWFHDSIAQLAPAQQRYALGLWLPAPSRAARFRALYDAFAGSYRAEWQPSHRPFMRVGADAAWLLTETRVDPSGNPGGPAWRLLWRRAFDSLDVPDDPHSALKHLDETEFIDAAELVELVNRPLRAERTDRLAAFTFGQRVFRNAAAADAPDILMALRGHQRFPMLMASLERLGATAPALYSAAARRAKQLDDLGPERGAIALRQLQATLALLDRVRATRAIDPGSAERIARTLVDIPLADGRYEGRIAVWIRDVFLPGVALHGPASDSIEDAVLGALAGAASRSEAGRARPVTWEGRTYRADVVSTELERLRRIRERQGGVSLDTAVELADLAGRLAAGLSSLESLRNLTKELQVLRERLRGIGPRVLPTADGWPDAMATLGPALEELAKITSLRRPDPRVSDAAARLFELSDALLADVLTSMTYALALGDPEERALAGPGVARRHDFGFDRPGRPSRRSAAWRLAQSELVPGQPWHVTGSLLGLDVGLAMYSLRRIGFDGELRPPVLNANDRRAFAESVALMNVFDLTDADRDAIARAIREGRARVSAASGNQAALEALAIEVGMDAWRAHQLRWVAPKHPGRVIEFFPISDLLRLGNLHPGVNLDAFGSSAVSANGCLCSRFPASPDWTSCTGRAELGLLGSRTADLTLRVVELMADLQLPAPLTRSVLAIATQEFVDRVAPADPDDWLVLLRSASALTREQIEDYTAALAGDGSLMPDAGVAGQVRR